MGEFLGGVLRDKMNSVLEENPALKKRVEDAPDKKDEFIHLRDSKICLAETTSSSGDRSKEFCGAVFGGS